MPIKTEENEIFNKAKRMAHLLGDKLLIVSKPDQARVFLAEIKDKVKGNRFTYKKLIKQVKFSKHLTHEVENLFDNYYIVDGAVSEILNTPVSKDYKKIVQIEKSSSLFIPRIYYILSELLTVTNYKIDREGLYSFLQAYQSRSHLSIRELSFIPFFLRTILIENIEMMMRGMIISLNEFEEAERYFAQIIKKKKKHNFSKLTANLTAKYGVIPINLGFNLLQRLSQYGPDTRPVVKWLKLNLLKQGININDLAEIENKRQSDISLQVSNIINSLRWVNQARWDDLVVDINIVDSFLIKDPAGVYAALDQGSQATYRNEVVKISDQAGIYESEVAKQAVRLCQQNLAGSKDINSPASHVGYYLAGAGRDDLEKKIGYQKPFKERAQALILRKASLFYLGLIFLIDVLLTGLVIQLFSGAISFGPISLLLSLLIFTLNCDIAINLVNIIISSLVPVRALFRLDLSAGVSLEQATFVIVPSMFRDAKTAQDLLRRLEVNFLGNSDENIYFALLMDFKDAPMEILPTDQALVDQVAQGIEALNKKYESKVKRFYLFHRSRLWNPHENVFMGWERKRGKLREFNLLLRNKKKTSYLEELPVELPFIKYVLTIDEDTRLPKDSAIKLIGCIDHPLNRPVLDETSGRVLSGYGIIQPRMTSKFSLARATAFSRMFSSAIGIDSYTGPAADVYQDLFSNSIFFGKGIYDVDTMEKTIGDRIPENQVLSHDLLEGLYTRVGFATDIFLFEGFPDSYKEFILRMHRWIRGDWQIIQWLKFDSSKNNHFLLSDKWKIFDNLRRSTLPIFAVVFLLLSFIFMPSFYPLSFAFVLLVIGSSFVISYLFRLFEWPKGMTLWSKVDSIFENLDSVLVHVLYRFLFLFDQAIVSLRAILVSLYRMVISHKRMLLWQNSHEVAKNLKGTLMEFIYLMFPAQILSFFAVLILSKYHQGFFAYLTLIFWFISPVIAYQISRKEKPYEHSISDMRFLRKVACRSTRFFLELSRQGGNHLIPDHYQEEPIINSPSATSPTNIGMHVLSNLSAFDLGFLSFSGLLERTDEVFDNLDKLERYKGHFYNWYDIHSLQSLNPKYVSSVDSANLLLSLLTFKQGILDTMTKPVIIPGALGGLLDVLAVMKEDAKHIISDISISRSEKKLVRVLVTEVKDLLNKYESSEPITSIEYLVQVLTDLVDSNAKFKKTVSGLNLGSNRGILSSIYSSVEHFNTLLKQQMDEVQIFLSFHQLARTRPVVHNENKNKTLKQAVETILSFLDHIPSLNDLTGSFRQQIEDVGLVKYIHDASLDDREKESIEKWYAQLIEVFLEVESHAIKAKADITKIISLLDKFFDEADFAFLYNKERGLFHIGYNVTYDKIDNSFYDFLASEANSVSFVSVIKKQVPLKHWFYLGRKLVALDSKNVLLSSWGGSLFEYLTSLIFFKVHPESLLGSTAKLAVLGHIKYGNKYKIPWGMGESAYTNLDLNNNYQYQIFGHPSLGLKRDLKDYLVVAPYTTIMSLVARPKLAMLNLRKLVTSKTLGRYGFYDAIDYTSSVQRRENPLIGTVAKIYYAHHQGFSLQALNNQINKNRIQDLFLKDPQVESLDTLFEEKTPSSIPARPIKSLERAQVEYLGNKNNQTETKQFVPLLTSYPRRAFLSNGSYQVNISNVGAGGSKVSDLCLTRFREDTLAEPLGQFIYLFDVNKNSLWSPTVQPLGLYSGKNKVEYFENKVKFGRIYNDIESSLTISVAADNDVEFRSLTLTNHSKETKDIKVINYGEVSLARYDEDLHHPAFEKLFIKSEFWPKYNALVYSRPSKSDRSKQHYFAHKIFTSLLGKSTCTHVTERELFIGRGGSLLKPRIISKHVGKIKSSPDYNFDPVFSFQHAIQLKHNETVTITYVNVFGKSQDEIIKSLNKYSNQKTINQAIKKSDKAGREIVDSLGLSQNQALSYQALASRLLSPHYSQVIKKFREEESEPAVQSFWRLGLSGDLPVLTVRFYDMNDLALIKNVLVCFKYLKHKGVDYDLVLLNEYPASYIKSFEDEVDFLIRYNQVPFSKSTRGRVFHLRSSHMSVYDRERLIYLSRVVIDSQSGTLEQQILDLSQSETHRLANYLKPIKKANTLGRDVIFDLNKLNLSNGFGGFTDKGAYVMNINHQKDMLTPSPWANIVANKEIGFVMTENGSSYTWLYDSYDNRLTKRIDDPVTDRSSEIFYLRDEETGDFWNPSPLPIKNQNTYKVTHGLGYTQFENHSRGLKQIMTAFVPTVDAVKIVKFKLSNSTKAVKRLSLTGFLEMSFGGANREDNKDYLRTVRDEETGATIVKNIYTESFKKYICFVDLNQGVNLISNDRAEFLGRIGNVEKPIGLLRDKLSNKIHDDVDHCVTLQTFFNIEAGEEKELIFLLGGADSMAGAQTLIKKYRNVDQCDIALAEVENHWNNYLNKIQIQTPDDSLNTLFNFRLLYQLISSRLIGRTGYAQPSGAFGFRDQLQDSMALVWTKPEITKETILRSSRHQFQEGDAQNWWHEHNSFGVRTSFSDHQIWLPYVTSFYLEFTADKEILDEKAPYKKGPLLDFINNPNWAGVPEVTEEEFDLYDHCVRAIDRTFTFGPNGLPLIGNGDWNDGLNKVGEKGVGESVWLGWFLYAVINKFLPYIKERGDTERCIRYETTAKNLQYSLEKNAWDGKWYKRAFFDNSTSLGSRSNREFKIDSISQSWAVLSGAASHARAKQAMSSVTKNLLQNDNLLLLISPAIEKSTVDPGYIRDYPAGVRENGAQYNHAALWAAQAYAEIDDPTSLMKILNSVNPIKRSADKDKAGIYRVEPYAVAGDIYAKPREAGRGGWTWYTGSAGVMYRTILESLLGLKVRGDKMEINPCIPKNWPEFSVMYTYKETKYNIRVLNVVNVTNKKIRVDGILMSNQTVNLINDNKTHEVEVKL